MCDVCHEQHGGLGNNLISNSAGGEGQELLRDLSSVLAPDLVPAPLATMEGESFTLIIICILIYSNYFFL